MTELLLPFVPVFAALAVGAGVSSYIRRSITIEPLDVETLGEPERQGAPRGRVDPPDATGANGVALDEKR